jgi:hypothetical protein
MKMTLRILSIFAVSTIVFLTSCKKENASHFEVTFTNNLTEGTADANGEFTLTGHISSQVRLDKVILTKQGETEPFLIDESTAKNKNDYDYSYLITGITANTTIIMDVYDQNGAKTSVQFLIKK